MEQLSEVEVLVGELESRVERLRALYEMYFMGIERTEPTVPRKDVDRRFYVLRRTQLRNTALRFRFQNVLLRYNTYQTYWTRIARQIEEGTYKRDVRRARSRFANAPKTKVDAATELADDDLLDLEDDDADTPPSLTYRADMEAPISLTDDDLRLEPETDPPAPGAPDSSLLEHLQMHALVRPNPAPALADPALARDEPPPPSVARQGVRYAQGAQPRRASDAPPPRRVEAPKPPRPTDAEALAARRKARSSRPPRPEVAKVPSPPSPASPPQPARPTAAGPAAGPPRAPAQPGSAPRVAPPPPSSRPALSDERLRQIYTKYVETKRALKESTASLTFDGLARSLRESSDKLRTKHTGKSVDYEVTVKDGRAILRPVVK